MTPANRVRLLHARDACRKIIEFCHERTYQSFAADEMLSLAVIRLIEVIGEAVKAVPESLRAAHSQVPWRAIASTRDRLIHGYFDVDLEIVWNIAVGDIPVLLDQLELMLKSDRLD